MVKTGNAAGKSGYIPELDGLRAVAILLVVIFHCRTIVQPVADAPGGVARPIVDPVSGLQDLYLGFAEAGWVGVDLFFVLSGFLITGILIDTVGKPGYFRSFYIRRVLRIFPLYYAALAAFAIGYHLLGIQRLAPASTGAEVAHWFYVQNWLPLFGVEWTRPLAHFWSLGVEEQFYLCWPALVLVSARRNRVAQLCLWTIAFALVMRLLFWWAGVAEEGNFATVTKMDTLAIGGYLACLQRGAGTAARPGWLDRVDGQGRGLTVALVVSALAVLAVAAWGGSFFRPTNRHIFLFGLFPVAVLFGATLGLTILARDSSPWIRFLRTRPMLAIGKVSYGIYIVHWPLVLALQPLWPHLGGFWIQQASFLMAITLGSYVLAALSYYLYERRFLELKDRLAPRN
jgi:peptidoglycan/LPS O-acetylase OafA/YrhL